MDIGSSHAIGVAPQPLAQQGQRKLMRKYDVAVLMPDGEVDVFSRLAPATPSFENSFNAFARGTLFQTARGIVAIEDLWPGDVMRLADGRSEVLAWRGSIDLVPQAERCRLVRFSPEALGYGRPASDLVLGGQARIYHRSPGIRRVTGHEGGLIPAADFVDGVGVIEVTPGSGVQMFHLAFQQHERLLANGVEVESLHPGTAFDLGLRGEMLGHYLSFFPHHTCMADFGQVGAPRLRMSDLELIDVA